MATREIDIIKRRSKDLPPKQKLELIEFLTDLLAHKPQQTKMIEYGKYANSGRRISTEDDFKIAEWRPSDEELNGN